MERKEFKEALMLYGADLSAWPIELNDEGTALLTAGGEVANELAALVEEEGKFEMLLAERTFEAPGEYLASRIIACAKESAIEEAEVGEAKGLLGWIVSEFFAPRAAIALALTLVIGFMAGYMAPQVTDPLDQLILDDSVMLEETFSSLFMEGDIFE
jgi:hypothetical protein